MSDVVHLIFVRHKMDLEMDSAGPTGALEVKGQTGLSQFPSEVVLN